MEKDPLYLPQNEPFLITGLAGNIEAQADMPKPLQLNSDYAMVICHPNPLQQGSMTNKVVVTLGKASTALGIPAIRFNFRGVGLSEGSYGDMIGEIQDLTAVLVWLEKVAPNRKLILAGFSFGSYIAAKVCERMPNVVQLISIAPPMDRYDFEALRIHCPWLIVQGDADEIISAEAVFAFADGVSRANVLVNRITGGSHFFHGRLVELRFLIELYLNSQLSLLLK